MRRGAPSGGQGSAGREEARGVSAARPSRRFCALTRGRAGGRAVGPRSRLLRGASPPRGSSGERRGPAGRRNAPLSRRACRCPRRARRLQRRPSRRGAAAPPRLLSPAGRGSPQLAVVFRGCCAQQVLRHVLDTPVDYHSTAAAVCVSAREK